MFDRDKTIKFEVVTPEKVLFKEEIVEVTVPTREGEITILPKHMPLVSILEPGVLEFKKKDGTQDVACVFGGFIEVLRNKVVVLADSAERACDIDFKKAENARDRAEKEMKEIKQFDSERYAGISSSLARELAKTKAVIRWKKIKKM